MNLAVDSLCNTLRTLEIHRLKSLPLIACYNSGIGEVVRYSSLVFLVVSIPSSLFSDGSCKRSSGSCCPL